MLRLQYILLNSPYVCDKESMCLTLPSSEVASPHLGCVPSNTVRDAAEYELVEGFGLGTLCGAGILNSGCANFRMQHSR